MALIGKHFADDLLFFEFHIFSMSIGFTAFLCTFISFCYYILMAYQYHETNISIICCNCCELHGCWIDDYGLTLKSKMNIQERLQKVRKVSGLSINAFALAIGVSRTRFANYLTNRDPDFEVLSRICEVYPNINSEWLLTGNGNMEKCVNAPQFKGAHPVVDVTVQLIIDRDEKLIRENERLSIKLQQLEQK